MDENGAIWTFGYVFECIMMHAVKYDPFHLLLSLYNNHIIIYLYVYTRHTKTHVSQAFKTCFFSKKYVLLLILQHDI